MSEDLIRRREHELNKYRELLVTRPSYGSSNHGKDAWDTVVSLHEWREFGDKIIDVGCGQNQFVLELRREGVEAVGVDPVFPQADIQAPAHKIPLPDGCGSVITAFDVLEHILEDDIRPCLLEFRRLAPHFVFSIAYRPSNITTKSGENLHPTVRPKIWWIEMLSTMASIDSCYDKYIVGTFKGWYSQ